MLEYSVKNHADALILHTAICAEASQNSPYPTAEIKDFLLRDSYADASEWYELLRNGEIMDSRNLDKALEIISKLIMGEEIKETGENSVLYNEYNINTEVYDIVDMSLKKMNLCVYEYKNSLFACPTGRDTVFGFSNEELRKELGLRYNKELYLAYFIVYNIITEFYTDTISMTYSEYTQIENIIKKTDGAVSGIIDKRNGFVPSEVEENSFKQIALSWDELPAVTSEMSSVRAAKNSKAGFVKLVFNFLVLQNLFIVCDDRYYPTDRFRGFIENYMENSEFMKTDIIKYSDK